MAFRTLAFQCLKRFHELAISFELSSCLTTVSRHPHNDYFAKRCNTCLLVHTCTRNRNRSRIVDDDRRTTDCVKSQSQSCTYNVNRILSPSTRPHMTFKREFSSHCKLLNAKKSSYGNQHSSDIRTGKLVNRSPVEADDSSLAKNVKNDNLVMSGSSDVSHDTVLEDTTDFPQSLKLWTSTNDELHDSEFDDAQSVFNDDVDDISSLQPTGSKDIGDYTPLPKRDHTFPNFGPLIERSEVLTTLLLFGVNLWKIQKNGHADILLRLDLQRDVAPILLVFHQTGFQDLDLAEVFTKYPQIFNEDADDIEVRLNYLLSKKFKMEDIISIVKAMPSILSTPTVETDSALGFYQKFFKLKGSDLRHAMTTCPHLIEYDKEVFKNNCYIMKLAMGFQTDEIKTMFVQAPQVFVLNKDVVSARLDFLNNVLGFDHQKLSRFPQLLTKRSSLLKIRHHFLRILGKDQYDPTKPNYVSGLALSTTSDEDFIKEVAKSTRNVYEDFLKTL